jgi:hypothetical protein
MILFYVFLTKNYKIHNVILNTLLLLRRAHYCTRVFRPIGQDSVNVKYKLLLYMLYFSFLRKENDVIAFYL